LWLPLDDLATDMAQGWKGNPLDVVTVADGSLVSLDNRRLAAAKLLDISVPIVIRDPASVWHKIANRDGIFNQIHIRGTNLNIDMFGNLR
jgi:hypothetical protein